jgi:hypothetical protein
MDTVQESCQSLRVFATPGSLLHRGLCYTGVYSASASAWGAAGRAAGRPAGRAAAGLAGRAAAGIAGRAAAGIAGRAAK